MKALPKSKFSCQVLKLVVGDERADKVLASMSMSILPNVGGGSIGKDLFGSKYHSSRSLFLHNLLIFYRRQRIKESKRNWQQYKVLVKEA